MRAPPLSIAIGLVARADRRTPALVQIVREHLRARLTAKTLPSGDCHVNLLYPRPKIGPDGKIPVTFLLTDQIGRI